VTKRRKAPGAGTISERVTPSGEVRFDVRIVLDGVRHGKTLRSRAEAEAFLAQVHHERAQAGHFQPYDAGILTLRQLGHLYLAALPEARLVTDRSRWRARVETAEFADWPVTQISEQAVRRWIDRMSRAEIRTGKSAGKRPSRPTLQNALNLLRSALSWAVIHGHLDTNAAKNVTIRESTVVRPRSAGVGEAYDYLREDEVRKILEADVPATQRAAFTLLAFTGARPKDLYLLTWDRVDMKRGVVRYHSHKRSRDYTVHLLPVAHEAIRTWWMAQGQPVRGLLFPSKQTKQRGPQTPHTKGYDWGWAPALARGKMTRGYRARIGIRRDVPLYSLRHTCASHLLLGSQLFTGGRIFSKEEVVSVLGHADDSTVHRYMVSLGVANQRAVEDARELIRTSRRKGAK